MKKRLLVLLVIAFVSGAALAHAGVVKNVGENVGQGVVDVSEPAAEDADYVGRSVFWGIGAMAIAPFRWAQDGMNAMFQGMSNEKLIDHTN